MKRLIALTLTAVLTVAAPPATAEKPEAGPALVRDCNHAVDFNLKISSARNMRCRAARRVMRRHNGSIAPEFNAPNGFRCKLATGTPLGGQWRCTRGRKAFRFEFGD